MTPECVDLSMCKLDTSKWLNTINPIYREKQERKFVTTRTTATENREGVFISNRAWERWNIIYHMESHLVFRLRFHWKGHPEERKKISESHSLYCKRIEQTNPNNRCKPFSLLVCVELLRNPRSYPVYWVWVCVRLCVCVSIYM